MNDLPIDKDEILKELDLIKEKDLKYSGGRILGSMCTEAHPFAKEVYCKFLDTNLAHSYLTCKHLLNYFSKRAQVSYVKIIRSSVKNGGFLRNVVFLCLRIVFKGYA